MDFKAQEMDFQEADRRYAELEQQHAAGAISEEEFEAQRQQLMVLDAEGHWWTRSPEPGEWYYYDGSTWVPGTPPSHREDASETVISPAQAAPAPEAGRERRRRMPLWIPVFGLGGLALIGIVLVVWVLAPSLPNVVGGLFAPDEQPERAQNRQGEEAPGKQGPVEQEVPAAAGVAFDAAFVHSATPENITANSTYLDNPLTNGDPNAMIHVTQNWNPGDGDGTYNDHAIGVWYDDGRQKWAIFNQDRDPMTEGADFNVGIMKQE